MVTSITGEPERWLIGKIANAHPGPALVIGGGPSAPGSLEHLAAIGFKPAVVISANEHGFLQELFPPDYAVCCDPTHGVTRANMETLLGRHGKPIITVCHFGHYRLPDWTLACNSGLTAIVVAAMLGSSPLVAVGFDFYRHAPAADPGRTYFHHTDAELTRDSHNRVSNSNVKSWDNFEKQLRRMSSALRDRRIVRPLEGRLLDYYPRFDPDEIVSPAGRLSPMCEYTQGRKTLTLKTGPSRRCVLSLGQVEFNRAIPVSEDEAVRLINGYQAAVTWPTDHPLIGYRKGKPRPPDLLPPPPDRWPGLR